MLTAGGSHVKLPVVPATQGETDGGPETAQGMYEEETQCRHGTDRQTKKVAVKTNAGGIK